MKISNIDDNRDLVLGEDNELNVNFRLSNIGKEPAIGTNFTFSLPVDLEIMDLEGTQCTQQHIDNEGSGEDVCKIFQYKSNGTSIAQIWLLTYALE